MINAYIFDLDGVLSNNSERVHLLQQSNKTKDECWQEFFDASADDKPYQETCDLLKFLWLAGYEILLVTGRSNKYNYLLETWLEKVGIRQYITKIFTREEGDYRKDYEVKKEIYLYRIEKNWNIVGIFEDRKECVDMWRSFGLICYQPRESIF